MAFANLNIGKRCTHYKVDNKLNRLVETFWKIAMLAVTLAFVSFNVTRAQANCYFIKSLIQNRYYLIF